METLFRPTPAANYEGMLRVIIARMLPEIKPEDIVRLRKPHPCGSYEWKVYRMGADIGLECLGCSRRVLLPRRELARRLKSIKPKENDP